MGEVSTQGSLIIAQTLHGSILNFEMRDKSYNHEIAFKLRIYQQGMMAGTLSLIPTRTVHLKQMLWHQIGECK